MLNVLFGKKIHPKGVELVPNFNLYCAGKSRKNKLQSEAISWLNRGNEL